MLKENLETIDYYSNKLRNLNACEMKCPSPGNVCYIKQNDKFYRAKFLRRISPISAQVQLVDTGLISEVHPYEVKIMISEYLKKPPCAYRCCLLESRDLEVSTSDYYKNKEFAKYFGKDCVIKVLDNDEGVCFVAFEEKRSDESSSLSENKEAVESSILSWSSAGGEDFDLCNLSNVTSINEFTLQSISKKDQLKDLIPQWQSIIKKTSAESTPIKRVEIGVM